MLGGRPEVEVRGRPRPSLETPAAQQITDLDAADSPGRAAHPSALDQGDPLSTAPPLHLVLEAKGILDAIELPGPDKPDWSSSTELYGANLPPGEVCDGVTSPVRTVIDCARAYPFDVALEVADSALRAGIPHAELRRAAQASPRTGRARAVAVVEAADIRAANPVESALRGIAKGVPGLVVEPQQWVGDIGRADLMDHRLRLVIEAESFEFHADSDSFGRDVRRYTGFARLGYTVVRFTWKEVMFDPDYVRAVLTDLVALGPRACASRPAA